jgi:hypothetical protein
VLYEETSVPGLKLLRVAHTALKLVSGQAVKGLLYQQQGGADVKLLNDVSDLSTAAGALLTGVLHQESQMGALRLVSGQAVKGLLYQQQGGADVKLLNDVSDLSTAAGQLVGFLYRDEALSQ